jgi:hypothetical protein
VSHREYEAIAKLCVALGNLLLEITVQNLNLHSISRVGIYNGYTIYMYCIGFMNLSSTMYIFVNLNAFFSNIGKQVNK